MGLERDVGVLGKEDKRNETGEAGGGDGWVDAAIPGGP